MQQNLELSTAFKTASFFYDYHLLTVVQQIEHVNANLNLSFLLYHLLMNYRQSPRHATNFVKEIKIRIEIGHNIKPQAFFEYFCEHIKQYGFIKTFMAPVKSAKYPTAMPS